MTTITIKNSSKFDKTEFDTIEEFQLYLLEVEQNSELSSLHKSILDNRLLNVKNKPNEFLSLNELKSAIKRSK